MFNWIVDYLEKTILWYSHPLCMIVCKSSQSSYIILPRTGSHIHGIVFLVSMSNSAKHLSDARIALEIVSTPLFIPLCEISIVFFGWANCVQTLVCTTIFTLWKPIYLFGTQQWTFSTPPLKTRIYIWVLGIWKISFLPAYLLLEFQWTVRMWIHLVEDSYAAFFIYSYQFHSKSDSKNENAIWDGKCAYI